MHEHTTARMNLRLHVPEPRCATHTPEPARARARSGTLAEIRHTRAQIAATRRGVPAFLGAERPLVDAGHGTGSAAQSSLPAQWRVPVAAAGSPSRSGRGSMWASNDYISVRMGQEGPQGSGWDSRVGAPCPSSPFKPLRPARWRPSAQVHRSLAGSLSPHLGASWVSPRAGWAPWGGDSSGRHQVAACTQVRTSGYWERRALEGACVTPTHPPSTRRCRSVSVSQLRDRFVEVTVHVHGAE